jgi:hypothetical protein
MVCVVIGVPQTWSILYVFGGENIAGSYEFYMGMIIDRLAEQTNGPYLLTLSFCNTFVCALNGILEGNFSLVKICNLY